MRDDGLVHVYLLLSTLFCFVNLAVTHKLYILGIDDETKQVAFSKAQLKHTFERNVLLYFPLNSLTICTEGLMQCSRYQLGAKNHVLGFRSQHGINLRYIKIV